MLVSNVLYGVLVDDKENESREDDLEKAYKALDELKLLTSKTYTDRNGFLKDEEKEVMNYKITNPLKTMPKTNRKPGVHLHRTQRFGFKIAKGKTKPVGAVKTEYYWIIISKNGKTIDRSTNMYSRKRDALNGIIVIADVLTGHKPKSYFDHTGKNGVEVVEF